MPTKNTSSVEQLEKSIKSLTATVRKLPDLYGHLFYVKKSLWVAFLRGVMYGLGFVVGIALVVPIIVGLLRYVEWVPLIGDFVTQVIERIQSVNGGF